ncbi:hypothetical protein [Ferrimicrobium sp.]|nr:hypothetical protein [Ferrimicrobium sp.]
MGETTTQLYAREGSRRHRPGSSDKDVAQGILVLPRSGWVAVRQAAIQVGSEGLLLLLTKYFLSPKQICSLYCDESVFKLRSTGEIVEIFTQDAETVRAWLDARSRPRNQKAIRDHLYRAIQPRARAIVARQSGDGMPMLWSRYLVVGVRDLRRWAMEEHARACAYDEGVYRELLHDEAADVDDTLRVLTHRTRLILGYVAEEEAAKVRQSESAFWGFS